MSNTKMQYVSEMMIKLYGEEDAVNVSNRCYEVDEQFGDFVQTVVYDQLWAANELSLADKSLITVITLIVMGKAEQLQIHTKGYLHANNDVERLFSTINYLAKSDYIDSNKLERALSNVQDVIAVSQLKNTSNNITLDKREIDILDIVSHVTLGDSKRTRTCLTNILMSNNLLPEEIKAIIRHQMMYCGCPCVMDGLAILKEIMSGK